MARPGGWFVNQEKRKKKKNLTKKKKEKRNIENAHHSDNTWNMKRSIQPPMVRDPDNYRRQSGAKARVRRNKALYSPKMIEQWLAIMI